MYTPTNTTHSTITIIRTSATNITNTNMNIYTGSQTFKPEIQTQPPKYFFQTHLQSQSSFPLHFHKSVAYFILSLVAGGRDVKGA